MLNEINKIAELTVFVKMDNLGCANYLILLLVWGLASDHWVNYDSAVVHLRNLIKLPKVTETDLIICRDKEVADLATDSHVYVSKAPIHMYKHYVVVKDE